MAWFCSAAAVARRRIRFNRAALPGEKGAAGKDDGRDGGKAEAVKSGATTGTPGEPAEDDAARARLVERICHAECALRSPPSAHPGV